MKMDKPSQYFEGILQLRDCSDEVIEFIDNLKGADEAISRIKKVEKGLDIYMRSNKYLLKLGKRLNEEFTGDLKISKKLFSRDHLTSKDIYRMTVLFRQCPFRKGDMIMVKGEKYEVIGCQKKIICKPEGAKSRNFTYQDLIDQKAKKI